MTRRSIWASHAVSEKRVAISVGELRHEDPFSSLLLYDEDFDGNWGFVDIPRTIKSITSLYSKESKKEIFIAMSNEGDVYYIEGDVPFEKIPGAGVFSDDAEGFGSMNFITNIENTLVACGNGSQVYRREGHQSWLRLCDSNNRDTGENSFVGLSYLSNIDRLVVCGHSANKFRDVSPDEHAEIQRIKESGDKKKYKLLLRKYRKLEKRAAGCIYFLNGKSWITTELPNSQYLNGLERLDSENIIVVGSGGTLLKGQERDGLEDVSDSGLLEKFRAARVYGTNIYVLGSTGVYIFNFGFVLEESIPLPDGLSDPISIDIVDDTIWYFDHAGIARHCGSSWERIEIPQELWLRDGE